METKVSQIVDRKAVKRRLVEEKLRAEEEERKKAQVEALEQQRQSNNRREMGIMTAWAWLDRTPWDRVAEVADAIYEKMHWTSLEVFGINLAVPIRDHSDYIRAVVETIKAVRQEVEEALPF